MVLIMRLWVFFSLFGFFNQVCFAQDIRGAVLRFEHIFGLTFAATLDLIVDEDLNFPRPEVFIESNGIVIELSHAYEVSYSGNKLKKVYFGVATFLSPGVFEIVYLDHYRIADIENIGLSANSSILISLDWVINPFMGSNASPIVYNSHGAFSFNEGTVFYDPNVWDPDGDSLHFAVVDCQSAVYTLPEGTSIDPETGLFSFIPEQSGLYAFCIEYTEWRNGLFAGGGNFEFVINVTDVMLAVSNIENNPECRIFPNPATDVVNVTFSLPLTGAGRLAVIDHTGRQVLSQTISAGTTTAEVDVRALAAGVYLLRIEGLPLSQSGGTVDVQTIKLMIE